MNFSGLRIGYVPCSPPFSLPGDRRRFVHYAKRRGIEFEIANPSRNYDVVVLTERADLSVWHRYRGGKVVYDLIDSYLAVPRSDVKGRLRGLAKFVSRQSRYPQLDYWRAVAMMCERADAVICSTEEQKKDISPYCSNVHLILDIHSMLGTDGKSDYHSGPVFRLVWEGLPQTLDSLATLAPVLGRIGKNFPMELHVITDFTFNRYLGRYGRAQTEDVVRPLFPNVVLHEWREDTLAATITGCDLAVISLNLKDAFAAGKPENKLLLFWRLGMPAVVSATPAYVRAMVGAGLDMTCVAEVEWQTTLERYICDETARRRAGTLARRFVEEHHSEEKILGRWDAVFQSLV